MTGRQCFHKEKKKLFQVSHLHMQQRYGTQAAAADGTVTWSASVMIDGHLRRFPLTNLASGSYLLEL